MEDQAKWLTSFIYRPGTTLLWALTIVELLCGKEKRDVS